MHHRVTWRWDNKSESLFFTIWFYKSQRYLTSRALAIYSSYCTGKSHSLWNEIILNYGCYQTWFTYTPPAWSPTSMHPKPDATNPARKALFHQNQKKSWEQCRNRGGSKVVTGICHLDLHWGWCLDVGARKDWFEYSKRTRTRGLSQMNPKKQQADVQPNQWLAFDYKSAHMLLSSL